MLNIAFPVVEVANLSFPALTRQQSSLVEVVTGNVRRRTNSVKAKKDEIARWDSKLHL